MFAYPRSPSVAAPSNSSLRSSSPRRPRRRKPASASEGSQPSARICARKVAEVSAEVNDALTSLAPQSVAILT
eukprot:9495591-Alexandrium_andersonii.AAC.1